MIVGVFAVGIAAVTDVWKFKVHNLLTIPLLLSGLIFHGITGGWEGFAGSLLGSLFGFVILIGFYVLGGMGAGDVKLMAALGAWFGPLSTACLFIASALAAGIYALALILIYGRVKETWNNLRVIYYRLAILGRYLGSEDRLETEVNAPCRRHRVIPFAAMMALGLFALLAWHWLQGRS
jgi:prepilin peptidase CpaA